MYYKAQDNSLHALSAQDIAAGGEAYLPLGCVPITDEEAEALRPQPSAQAILEAKKTQLRTVREGILNRLSGIALAAQLTGDAATTAAYITVRQGLLDITENLPADATVDGVVMYRYAALVGACTPQMVTAFAQVDA